MRPSCTVTWFQRVPWSYKVLHMTVLFSTPFIRRGSGWYSGGTSTEQPRTQSKPSPRVNSYQPQAPLSKSQSEAERLSVKSHTRSSGTLEPREQFTWRHKEAPTGAREKASGSHSKASGAMDLAPEQLGFELNRVAKRHFAQHLQSTRTILQSSVT
ncbi:hypothetical protein EYF80_031871 [Liparis tanakae]|uniref:Uncharacterized protein n=1 Tax=Liparis tanakae TaxID=230148 RepID=A0A4Z2GXX1_9TELE|nr:hypothetical protein EYF80_031871 [Liparis tanakae]